MVSVICWPEKGESDLFVKIEHTAVIVQDWRAVQVLQQHRLRESRFVVQTRASISVMAGADFEVKGAVHPKQLSQQGCSSWLRYSLILFRSENRGQVFGSCVCVHFPLNYFPSKTPRSLKNKSLNSRNRYQTVSQEEENKVFLKYVSNVFIPGNSWIGINK